MPRSRPPRDPTLQFFIDRSLGYHLLPDALRARGFVVHRIVQRSNRPGPWICAVYERRIVQIWPPQAL